ncbi:hypothetical protein HHK36_033307 [Tetracentron sinense]|uniref:rRNA adenine N(6)-methyltransferase n=1 Tax=Tetracentron sinense TaxID=13715 RepID=A0A835CZM9_TETSI|nr:hypothetical protein HHK36_033307 [Tetracentron sinense]
MISLLQSLSPISSSPTSRNRNGVRPPLPNHIIQYSRRSFYVRNSRSEDDYHSTLKALKSRGRIPRKSLGQHYMLNSSVNEQLSSAAGVEDGDLVLEIGPGTGSLTNVLVNAGATVLAIEKDPHMAVHVRERFASLDQLTEEPATLTSFLEHGDDMPLSDETDPYTVAGPSATTPTGPLGNVPPGRSSIAAPLGPSDVVLSCAPSTTAANPTGPTGAIPLTGPSSATHDFIGTPAASSTTIPPPLETPIAPLSPQIVAGSTGDSSIAAPPTAPCHPDSLAGSSTAAITGLPLSKPISGSMDGGRLVIDLGPLLQSSHATVS